MSFVKKNKIHRSKLRGRIFNIFLIIFVMLINVGFVSIANAANNDRALSLNFQSIPVRSALQLLSQYADVNIVVSDSVQGDISLQLKNLPWLQAFNVILQSRGLAYRKIDNTYIVASAADIANQEQEELKTQKQLQGLEPIQSALIPISYGKAADMAAVLKGATPSIISTRGSVSFDARTNTLWVQDTPQKLIAIKSLIRRLDVPEKQVLIAAQIVNMDKSSEQELGIRWGISKPDANFTGTLEGANQLASGTLINDIPTSQRLNVDLPAANVGLAGGAASIGLALAKLSDGILLDLELSALQTSGDAHIIASPRLMTANQKEAVIESGEEIPYQEATSSGATAIAFKKAVLSLKVTPHITPDNRIILDLQVNQDKRGAEVLSGIPTIDTREIQTQVLVNNGQTIVLGGIFQQVTNSNIERVPFLGSLPIIGYFFRHSIKISKQTELLIFVTPKIVQQQT